VPASVVCTIRILLASTTHMMTGACLDPTSANNCPDRSLLMIRETM
jgi:hypothetical protein